jgi:hypothetical protein
VGIVQGRGWFNRYPRQRPAGIQGILPSKLEDALARRQKPHLAK